MDPVLHQLTPWGRQGLFHENLLESSGEEVGGTRSHARILHWRELCAVVYLSNDLRMLLSCVCWGGAYCQYILEMAFPHKVGVCARARVCKSLIISADVYRKSWYIGPVVLCKPVFYLCFVVPGNDGMSVCPALCFLLSSMFPWLYCHLEPCFGGQKNA